ncbi:threonine---tRNA ligase [Synchytrium microbalum]|uniref:Threonine--tRNA ligase, cytoplasmic n=1 Tax=Synchytrium microbalum TaxID=1806994 RepID=A0A507BWL0_9FUNG|nr:threonine---tRNA ligase [Synchytrium microbalum]TPX31548.1 threonine---tRNA ligase [Synchytrium microbalum]
MATEASQTKAKADFLDYRIQMFDKLMAEYTESQYSYLINQLAQPRKAIKITLPDSRQIDGISWETTPFDIAKSLSKSLADKVVISKVNGVLWDLLRPFEEDSVLQLLDFENEEGKAVFWHSSAHVLGEACELHYGCHLSNGPPVEDGFYYDMAMDKTVALADYEHLEKLAQKAVSEKQPFQRLVMTKEDLLEMFKYNKYKVHFIRDKIPDGTSSTVYRCGPLIDLCAGPHVPNTNRIKSFAVMKSSSAYFLGDAKNDSLQRIYGVSFPDAKMMKEYKKFLEEAAKRDHRRIGTDQELFFFHEWSPGSPFFLPAGARLYNLLIELQRAEYRRRGFSEVVTPNMYNSKLWKTSGHWENYQEDMFIFDIEKEKFGLKPMNCPGHCLMFKHQERSYRELPLRLADFGVLHRNEASGALTGLTRVRRFQQDDAHIFCRIDQVEGEIQGALEFLRDIYEKIFGFSFSLKLSTRPEKFLGRLETWEIAEKMLSNALDKFGQPWDYNPGDGAFYGPKIDIRISDALNRKHQCATIQLDFQLPDRFDLTYQSNDPNQQLQRPVMIHRAVLGSVERFIAILTENYGGKWPFWLAPKQVTVIPIMPASYAYAEKVKAVLQDAGFVADADVSDNTREKKIRNAEISHVNFIFVVGAKEEETNTVNVRNRDDTNPKGRGSEIELGVVIQQLIKLRDSKASVQFPLP